ncbi:MAG: OsmC family protein [Candidatus Bathyarchaeia archaeon]|jgi:uncharacterized OsmC-like protein
MSSNLTKFRATFVAKEYVHISSTLRTHSLEIDEPKELGGSDKGPNPVELILAALGGCQQIILRFYGKKLGVDIQAVETTVEGELDLGAFLGVPDVKLGFQKITATTKLKAKGDPEKIKELLKIAEERCPVLYVLKNDVPVQVNIELK